MTKSREYTKIEYSVKQFKAMLDEILTKLGDLEERLEQENHEIRSYKYRLTCFKTNLKQLKLRKKYGDNPASCEREEITGDITGCFIANLLLSLLLQLPKVFIIVVIWLK